VRVKEGQWVLMHIGKYNDNTWYEPNNFSKCDDELSYE